MSKLDHVFRPIPVFSLSIAIRLLLLVWGRYQDTHSPLKYTDIDYLVFTDASRYISQGRSPYDRETYRYTPLLAWLLYPTTFYPSSLWFDFGKVIFAAGDVVTGYMLYKILTSRSARKAPPMSTATALKYASIWLLNPMVANISTRGSSEGLLAVIVIAVLWAALTRHIELAGILLGLGVHFKIYPFIYAASIFWSLGRSPDLRPSGHRSEWQSLVINCAQLKLGLCSLVTFMVLNVVMYTLYGKPFLEHSYLYHVTRIDHRHNFSVYNTLLHLGSASGSSTGFAIESLAFIPQLSLAVLFIPLALARRDLANTMLAQTLAFVTFNKVCTSQYFLWYMVFLPLYLPESSLIRQPRLGLTVLIAWSLGQAAWLQQGYELEFLGRSTFVPGLWLATMLFFAINCWILGIVICDVGLGPRTDVEQKKVQ